MLTVKTPDEVFAILKSDFPQKVGTETAALSDAHGRVLAKAIESSEYVPGFARSTVDGYAVLASDTFGCSDSIPAILPLADEICMGEKAEKPLLPGTCVSIPTGGAVPEGADAIVMLEYTEDYGDGTIGILQSAVPGANLIFKGDDVYPGKQVLKEGRLLTPQDVGALAAMGVAKVPVSRRPVVGILSTGDELVPVEQKPEDGQVRDVNSAMLRALMLQSGAEARNYGIIRDEESVLQETLGRAVQECDVVLISGGSSVGAKDAACRVIESQGELLFHGIAMKPGKPTILGKIKEKPVFGLPGHPVAAFFITQLFVRHLLAQMMGRTVHLRQVPAVLTETVSANHGRAQYGGVFLSEQDDGLRAVPIRGKSGLITALAGSDGWFCIPRDREGIAAGETILVTLYTVD